MATKQYTWIVQVAGLARDGLTSSNSTTRERVEAMAITSASADAQPSGTICDVYQPYMRPQSLRMGEMTFGPITGKTASSSVSFDLILSPDRPEIGRFFLAPQRSKRPILQINSGQTLDVDENSARFTPIDDPSATLASLGVQEGSILYNGREALRVASVNDTTDEITFVNAIPAGDDTAGTQTKTGFGIALRRGQCGTYIESHIAIEDGDEPPFVDARWFDASPFVTGREVRILRYDGESARETVWWRGVIDGEPTLAQDGITLTVKCVDIFQALKNAKINTRASVGRAVNAIQTVAEGAPLYTVILDRPWQDTRDALYRSDIAGRGAVYQFGKSVIAAEIVQPVTGYAEIRSGISAFGGDPLDVSTSTTARSTDVKLYELLVSDPLDGTSPAVSQGVISAANHPLYCTDLPDRSDLSATRSAIVDHPILIALALMRGLTCPNLPDHWTIPVPTEFLDVDSFTTLAYETYERIDAWPGMVAGKDGKPIKAWEFINEELLNGLGVGLAYGDPSEGKGGQVVVRSLFGGNANLADEVTLSAINAGRGATIQTRLTADSLIVRSGQGIGDAPRFTSVSGSLFRTRFFPYDDDNIDLRAPGLIHPDDPSTGAAVASIDRVNFLAGIYRQFADLLRTPLVTVSRRVTSDRLLYPGQWLLLSDTGGIDQTTGGRVTATAATTLAIVVSVRVELEAALDQTVQLYLLPFGLSRIGPAGEVASGTSSTVVLEQATFRGPVSPYEPTSGISITRDAAAFEVGQKVVLLDSTLAKVTQVEEIQSVSSNTVNIVGTWTATGGGSYSPQGGDILTLADYSDSEADEQALYAYVLQDTWTL